jgi:hypothetical protein
MPQLRPILIHKHILMLVRRLLIRRVTSLKATECHRVEEEIMQTYLLPNLCRIGTHKQNKLV